eukprot:2260097-Rhodomonas_salina.1
MFNLRGPNVLAAVCNVSITHVALGSGQRLEEWGTFKHQALADRVGSKNRTYTPFHRDRPRVVHKRGAGDCPGVQLLLPSHALLHCLPFRRQAGNVPVQGDRPAGVGAGRPGKGS